MDIIGRVTDQGFWNPVNMTQIGYYIFLFYLEMCWL